MLVRFQIKNRRALIIDLPQDWTNYIRTVGHGLNMDNIESIISDALETNLFDIHLDNDVPGRCESFLDPSEKFEA